MAADNIFDNKTYISELNDLILAEKIENQDIEKKLRGFEDEFKTIKEG